MKREDLAKVAIKQIYNEYVGGLINTTYDYNQDTDEYKQAVAAIKDVEGIKEYIYRELVNYRPLIEYKGMLVRIGTDIRFLGTEKINNMIDLCIEILHPADLDLINN